MWSFSALLWHCKDLQMRKIPKIKVHINNILSINMCVPQSLEMLQKGTVWYYAKTKHGLVSVPLLPIKTTVLLINSNNIPSKVTFVFCAKFWLKGRLTLWGNKLMWRCASWLYTQNQWHSNYVFAVLIFMFYCQKQNVTQWKHTHTTRHTHPLNRYTSHDL